MFAPCSELQKARNPSAIFDSSFCSAWHIQTTATSCQFGASNPELCRSFNPHGHFLALDAFISFLDHLVTSHSDMCAHMVSISPAHKHTLKNLNWLSKWSEGLWRTSWMSRSLGQPSPLITFNECLPCQRVTLFGAMKNWRRCDLCLQIIYIIL